jgi:hypothetical protein
MLTSNLNLENLMLVGLDWLLEQIKDSMALS